jgi:hypothetical protein
LAFGVFPWMMGCESHELSREYLKMSQFLGEQKTYFSLIENRKKLEEE